MNDVLKGMWREIVVTYFEIFFQHLPGATEEDFIQDRKP
jgi:hypothetical protein